VDTGTVVDAEIDCEYYAFDYNGYGYYQIVYKYKNEKGKICTGQTYANYTTSQIMALNGEIEIAYDSSGFSIPTSYELKDVYFPEGKADVSKREARLFEKQDYVFDIVTQNGSSDEDRILDEINKLDEQEVILEESNQDKLLELDNEWDKVINEIHKKIDILTRMLNGRDRRTIKEARLEDKATILYMLMENYDQTIAQKMQDLADYISGVALPELLRLQDLAVK
jgi:hypothetical protein